MTGTPLYAASPTGNDRTGPRKRRTQSGKLNFGSVTAFCAQSRNNDAKRNAQITAFLHVILDKLPLFAGDSSRGKTGTEHMLGRFLVLPGKSAGLGEIPP